MFDGKTNLLAVPLDIASGYTLKIMIAKTESPTPPDPFARRDLHDGVIRGQSFGHGGVGPSRGQQRRLLEVRHGR